MGRRSWLLLSGGFISSVGDRFAAIAYALFAVVVHSPQLLSAIFAAELLPPLLLSLIGGVITDKYLRRWLWPTVLIMQAGCFIGMSQTTTSWIIIALVTASSSVTSVIGPVGTVLLRLVTAESAHAAVARWTAISGGFAAVGGTLAAAATFQVSATRMFFLVDAATFVALGVLGTLAMRGIELPAQGGSSSIRLADALLGFVRLGSKDAFGILGITMLVGVIVGTSLEGIIGVFFLRNVMHVAPVMYGVVIGSWAVGMMLGPVLLKAQSERAYWRSLMPACAIGMGICIAGPAVVVNVWVTIVVFVIGGAANGLFNFGITSAIFQGVQQSEQGRAWSAFGVLASSCTLIGYLAGAVAGATYAREIMLVSGILPAAVGLLTLLAFTHSSARIDRNEDSMSCNHAH